MTISSSTEMNSVIRLVGLEGSVLTDGDNGLSVRHGHLEPALALRHKIVVDFAGVEVATPSWLNAFLGGAILDHGLEILNRMAFVHCKDTIKQSIRMVVSMSGTEAKANRGSAV